MDRLEQQVRQIMERIGNNEQAAKQGQNQRMSLDMLNDRRVMKEIDESGHQSR